MLGDEALRQFWFDHIVEHTRRVIVPLAEQTYGPVGAKAAAGCVAELTAAVAALKHRSQKDSELNLQTLVAFRQAALRRHGIPDPFERTKQRENEVMSQRYPAVIADIKGRSEPLEVLRLLVEGVFAGNLFDLGASATAERFAEASPDFLKIRASLDGRRPWLVDHFDAFARRLLGVRGYRKALFFMDNAGSDAILGVIPLARWLAGRGMKICLLANERPALNDITISELRQLLRDLGRVDPPLAKLLDRGQITAVSSGSDTPLLDLRMVSDECNAHASGAELVILEGMARSLESNYHTAFRVDAVKLCILKVAIIAALHGGKMYDMVFRFDPAE
jgi:type II pantothenate kinase